MKKNSTKKTSFNFDSELLKELKLQSFKSDVTQTELIHKYIRYGLMMDQSNMENFKMNTIIIDESIMKKLLIKSELLGIDTNELANIFISRCLNEDINQSNMVNPEIHDLLDNDKPDGDTILERISGIIEIDSELDAVQLKKASQVRRI